MIKNRPIYLEKNLKHYKEFPAKKDFDIDFLTLPPLLNFDFHTLNGILPLTKSRFNFIGINGEADGKPTTIIAVNPLEIEYEYYKSIGVTEFQAIQIVFNFYAIEDCSDGSIKGLPYSVSLLPLTKNNKIDTWNIDFMKQLDIERISQQGGLVFTKFNPFKNWTSGMGMTYPIFSNVFNKEYIDTVGFTWGTYFLSPIYDKKEIIIPENKTYSPQINAKYRNYKTSLYFKNFTDTNPRRIWGCDSPIELFLLQGLYTKNLHPQIQTSIFKNGEIIPNYYVMQEDEKWIGQENLITALDFYFPEKKLAIFCDGKEFHNVEKDKKIDDSLKKIGINSLRFGGKEITENLENVLTEIESHLH